VFGTVDRKIGEIRGTGVMTAARLRRFSSPFDLSEPLSPAKGTASDAGPGHSVCPANGVFLRLATDLCIVLGFPLGQ